MKDFSDLYARMGRAMQTQHRGRPLGYYTADVGELGQGDPRGQRTDMVRRLRRRAALESARRQLACRTKSLFQGQVARQVNRLLKVDDFAGFAPRGRTLP
jgi:hypothetical protein